MVGPNEWKARRCSKFEIQHRVECCRASHGKGNDSGSEAPSVARFNACIAQHRRDYSSQNSHPDRPKPQYKIDDDRVVIWCDYACIEQDNPEKMRQGIASLISYAARSDVIITPVQTGT